MTTLLIVDDAVENLHLLTELLLPTYSVRAVTSGERALRSVFLQPMPDLILLDVMMPEMDGYEVLSRLKADPRTASIPVIFITALDGVVDETRGLQMGAADYITKPIQPAITLARIRTQLDVKAARDWLADQNAVLEKEVQRRMAENQAIQDVTIRAIGCLAEIRDPETGNHLRRTQEYIYVLCEHLKAHPRFADYLQPQTIRMLFKCAPLHDIGKVGIPDNILLKPAKLTDAEWTVMKTHATLGRQAIVRAQQGVGQVVPMLEIAKDLAGGHHEKWDGSGYPEGLAGDQIPIPARLMALADVFDALISRRPYKEPFTMERAAAIILAGRGTHFDPDIVDAFIAKKNRFAEIAAEYMDSEQEMEVHTQLLEGRL